MNRVLGVVLFLVLLFAGLAFADGPLGFTIVQQDTHSTITASWTYTPNPEYETWYEYWVYDEAADNEVLRDSTSLQEVTFDQTRGEVDKAYRFFVQVWIRDALGATAGDPEPRNDRFIVPARPAAGLLAKRDMVTSPIIIPNDPAFEQTRGTIWLEFETTADITSSQGIWSRDANGYGSGGHLSVWVQNGSVNARIQSDSISYQVQWVIVANAINQAAVEFGDDTGFRLHVNGALAMSDPYTGGTVGSQLDIAVGASKQNHIPSDSTSAEWTNPFSGVVRVSEYYLGRYDFSGRWGLPPLPPPAPVDSLNIEVANIDHGAMYDGATDFFVVHFTPILEASYIRTLVDGVEQYEREALLPVVGADWHVSCSGACKTDSTWRGWEMYNSRTGATCSAPVSGWTSDGTAPCMTKQEIISGNQRNPDCVGGRYWAKHDVEIECNFNILSALRASFNFPRGTNPLLRFEVLDASRARIGYWERSVS